MSWWVHWGDAEGTGTVNLALGMLSCRCAQYLPHPHPCLSGSLHTGHHSWDHMTLASRPWLMGMRTSAMGEPVWSRCGLVWELQSAWEMSHWPQHMFFSLQVWIWNMQRSQPSRIWQKPGHMQRNGREQIPWGSRSIGMKTVRAESQWS